MDTPKHFACWKYLEEFLCKARESRGKLTWELTWDLCSHSLFKGPGLDVPVYTTAEGKGAR